MFFQIKKLRETAIAPNYGTAGAAGADLYACIDGDVTLLPMGNALVPTGIAVRVPDGYAGMIYARSGLGIKHGITLRNCVGVVDSDYRGEVCVGLVNLSDREYVIKNGDRIAQMVITPVQHCDIVEVEELDETERGSGGFGSTGK